jgi:hypothetical protein
MCRRSRNGVAKIKRVYTADFAETADLSGTNV